MSAEVQQSAPFIAAVTCILLLLWISLKKVKIALDPYLRKIPGPRISSITNLPLKIAVVGGRRTSYIHALHGEYGPFVRISPSEIAIADIEAWRQIHRIGSTFRKNPAWYQRLTPQQYDDETCGVFGIVDLKKASARRRLFQQAGTKKIVAEWEPQVVYLADLAVQKMKRDLEQGQCDVVKWWKFLASDVSAELAFGENFSMVQSEEKSGMIRDIEASMPTIGLRLEFGWLFELLMAMPFIKSSVRGRRMRFGLYAQQAVRNTRQASNGLTKTLFSKMVLEDGSARVSEKLIMNESINVIVAGTETTAMTLTYLTYAVLRDENIKQKLISELEKLPDHPTGGQLEQVSYLKNVVQETLRLYPAIPASLPRVVPEGGANFGKFFVPAGTLVSTQAYTFHLDHKVFPDPLRFNPDRWLKATSLMREHMQAFGGPARSCIGQNIAELEILHAVFRFFRECGNAKLAETTTEAGMDFIDFFTIQPKSGVCMIVPS